ncbi:hypothetical protein D9M68_365730 [compost metagenome]
MPLKLVHINRCPVLAPLNVLREADLQRLQLDLAQCQARVARLSETQGAWKDKLPLVYGEESFAPCADPEQQLYDGFLGDRDRRLCEQVRAAEPSRLAQGNWLFDDARLPELLFRYRARNFPETLQVAEQQRWQEFCRQRLSAPEWGAPNTLADFRAALGDALPNATAEQRRLLLEWQAYGEALAGRYGL